MKYYDNLTHEEKIALTEEQIQNYIEIEIAHEGIMPVQPPQEVTLEQEGITKSEVAFDVGGLLFASEEDAHTVARMKMCSSNYDYQLGGYDYKYLQPITDKQVIRVAFYKYEDVTRIGEVLQRNKERRDRFDTEKKAYNKYIQETAKIRDSIWGDYHKEKDIEEGYILARNTLTRYKKLANGDEETAKNFFRNTYKDRPDIIETVLGEKNE